MNLLPARLVALLWANLILLAATARAALVTATYNAATDIPVAAASYTATGNTVNFTLNFAPPVGTTLTVVNNTGLAFIQGSFDNLAQGQVVNLTFGGVAQTFVANYFGGTGNDLVLQWAGVRLLAWGANADGELGNNSSANSPVPVPVDMTGVLAGKIVTAVATGNNHSLALCSDGTLAAWGFNGYGALGNNSTTNSSVPVLVSRTGSLAGKTVVAIAAGEYHNLALCSDGSLAAWGYNNFGQLGNGGTTQSNAPAWVNTAGGLAGKSVIAIAAGGAHSLALCTDGTLAAWGYNASGQLGNAGTANSLVPVLVNRLGVLAGKTVGRISAAYAGCLALCTDGTLAAWGDNAVGELGNNSTTNSSVPVLVNSAGVLTGKTVSAIFAGGDHCLALCTDGNVAGWGQNFYGELGNNSTTNSSTPVLLNRAGVFAGKTIAAICAGSSHSMAWCADGTLASWGGAASGKLGSNNQYNVSLPVLVNTAALKTGERFISALSGNSSAHNLALVASPPPPLATTLAASAITDTGCTLNASINARGSTTAVTFEYGMSASYGTTLAATPASASGATATAASAIINGLLSKTTYHYHVVATSGGGTVTGDDMTFTTNDLASLTSLTMSSGALSPAFSSINTSYLLTVPFATASITVTPVTTYADATVRVNGIAVASATASGPISLAVGRTDVNLVVTAAGAAYTNAYTVAVTRLPAVFTYNSTSDVPVTTADFTASGNTANFTLNCVPPAGTNLVVVKNTGAGFIKGAFDNLAQGQRVDLTYGGLVYSFVANYFGGTGNDLVLQWANTRILAWGYNTDGELGNNSTTHSGVPVPVIMNGVLAGKSVVAVAAGGYHNLALCADGTLAAWGQNTNGQLGNASGTGSSVPVVVNRTGVLSGKTVIAISAGLTHSLALCSDGTLASWGLNTNGQLGNNSTTQSNVPVAVNMAGTLAGRAVVAVSAGAAFNLALCADGNVVTWGINTYGQLGNNSNTQSNVPVLVSRSGVLAGKTVTAISAGWDFAMALCADGILVSWGRDEYGQLGNGGTTHSSLPVLVSTAGVLSGKSVASISSGSGHSLALCSDGTLAAWGYNWYGEVGDNTRTDRSVPLLVDRTGVLAGKTVVAASAGGSHCLALCADRTLTAWGLDYYGELGNGLTTDSWVPVAVNTTALSSGERIMTIEGGNQHNLAMVGSLPAPIATTLPASGVMGTAATLNANVNANGNTSTLQFEYGLTNAYGTTVAATPATLSGTIGTAVAATINGLTPDMNYHFRVLATSVGGTTRGDDQTFSTSLLATLSSLTLGTGTLVPDFSNLISSYVASVSSSTSTITLTPVVAFATATVRINGNPVASGTPSGPISLLTGDNVITVKVTTADGLITQTYTVRVTRLPAALVFNSASTVPVTVSDFVATGKSAVFVLNFAPATGTRLTVVNNTGMNPIRGTFDNLKQGGLVNLIYQGNTYSFIANYQGGTGNDLVLQWANVRLLGWGFNSNGQLGTGGTSASTVPVAVSMSGILAGKTVTMLSAGPSVNYGNGHSLALCADGTVAAWGLNTYGQLGNGSTANGLAPAVVSQTGVLAGKTVIAIAAGVSHSLALCMDGTLAAWGRNTNGQLGDNTTTDRSTPVLVYQGGALAGKTVIAVAAGGAHSLAACADGSVFAWGDNSYGQLGTGNNIEVHTPVAVLRTGVLSGKSVVAVSCGGGHSLVLCADGTVATCGYNTDGGLGNNSTTHSNVPVAPAGALAGRFVTAIATGDTFNLALCSDGNLASWGANWNGQLGNNSAQAANYSTTPVLVDRSGVLSGKTISAISTGGTHSLALCADGTMTAWGHNPNGQVGDASTSDRYLPVLVNTGALRTGEVFQAARGGELHSLAMLASPLQSAVSLAATSITGIQADVHGSVNANGTTTTIAFEYGLDTTYGTTVPATPLTVTGTSAVAVGTTISALVPGTTYHFRLVATSYGGVARGADLTFTTLSDNAKLAALSLNSGTLVPGFAKLTTGYLATVPYAVTSVALTPTTDHPAATIKINGAAVASGSASASIGLPVGNTAITTLVTAQDGITTKTYVITVTRLPQQFVFNSASDVPVTASGFATGGYPAPLTLNYAPTPGTVLTMVNNTGPGFIDGTFSNLVQGQRITLTFNGVPYDFVVNYYGGTGNDLLLQWAGTQLASWGSNSSGQLGDATTTRRLLPTPVDATGVLAGKTITAVAEGYLHSLALCSDGTIAAWGYNVYGQLGNNTAAPSSAPVAVDRSGVLAGRTVIAVAAGPFHNLALCSDGAVAAWGYNNYGQLGTGDTTTSRVPVLVAPTGALAGKQVVAVAAGAYHSFALCADGTLAAWGFNDDGELGNGGTDTSSIPVAVGTSGALAGKQIASLSAGQYHTLALCRDGTLVAWGYNNRGQLGNSSLVSSSVPVAIGGFGALAGKTVAAIRAGGSHSLVLCADGMLSAWGLNNHGQLGASGITQSSIPLLIDTTGIAAGITVAQIAVGGNHSLALCTNGSLAAWGDNASGQLGNGSLTQSAAPVGVDLSGLPAGARCMMLASGSASQHNLTVFGLPSGVTTPHAAQLQGLALDGGGQDAASALIAHAFGLDAPGAGDLPRGKLVDGNYVIEFTQPPGVTGITYGAESSATLLPGSWTEVPDSGTGAQHTFSLPVTRGQLFMRLRVTGK